MDHSWIKTAPKKRIPKYKVLKDRQADDKLRIAEQHAQLRKDFYERTGNRWLRTQNS